MHAFHLLLIIFEPCPFDWSIDYVHVYFLSALILEEIAIDNPIRQKEEEILKEAQELHLASLDLARYTVNYNKLQV